MSLLPRPRKSLRAYLDQYATEHTKLGTKLTHFVGIPMIVASLPTAFVNPPLAGGLFAGGWALQFLGHAAFEKQKPSFFADPFYLFIGPVRVAIEAGQMVGLVPSPLYADEGAKDEDPKGGPTPKPNGVHAAA